eukprot:1926754-Rhodomonas_salina.2
MLGEEAQLVEAMDLIEDIEQIVIEKEQMKAASNVLTGHLQQTLCNYDLLKMMVALGAKIATRGTSEVVPPVGTDIELLVLQLPLELTPVNLYLSFSGQMAPGDNLSFQPGILDMPPVLTKVDGTPLTEGKYAVIHVLMTAELRTFLTTGHGWEMGIEALDWSSEMVPVTAAIKHDRDLWVRSPLLTASRTDSSALASAPCAFAGYESHLKRRVKSSEEKFERKEREKCWARTNTALGTTNSSIPTTILVSMGRNPHLQIGGSLQRCICASRIVQSGYLSAIQLPGMGLFKQLGQCR